MKKRQLIIPILAGLVVGQIFAESESPLTVVNTLRLGYDDNVYRTSDDAQASAYLQDIIELSFRAALSERTDLIFTSRFDYQSDKEGNFYPSLYAVLTHSASPRLMLQLSDKLTSGNRTSSSEEGRYDYFENTLSFAPSYVLSPKDSLSAPVSYMIKRHDDEVDYQDVDIITGGVSWKRELSPQRTWAAINLNQMWADYVNRDSTYDSTRLTTEISHTFNPEWHGNVEAGVTFDKTDFTDNVGKNTTSDGTNPFFAAGLAYEPSPQTRFTADVSRQYKDSNNASYAGETSSALTLGAQHDFTAKIMGKVTARFVESEYDRADNEAGGGDTTDEYFDLSVRMHYKINRINFLELGLRHRETSYDDGDHDWDQNMVDVGWRVEL